LGLYIHHNFLGFLHGNKLDDMAVRNSRNVIDI